MEAKQLPTGSQRFLSAAIALIAATLLFARLGHYALWDDEAVVALSAKGVLQTGDTSAVIGHNIVAYNGGILLRNLHDRSTPPLPAYVTAVAMRILGDRAWCLRLPFALCGLGTVVVMLCWLRRLQIDRTAWFVAALAMVGNVSFFLFCRQCRYYGPAILITILILNCYTTWSRTRANLLCIAFASILLFASNYLNYLALYAVLVVDYLFWGRRQFRLRLPDLALLVVPQLLLCGAIFAVWNPLRTGNAADLSSVSVLQRFEFVWWFLRDLNACEFGVAILLVIAPVVYRFRRNSWLLRLPIALLAYVLAISALCPVNSTGISEVRYLAPTIPLWIALAVVAIREITGDRRCLAIGLAILAFATNLFQGSWLDRSSVAHAPFRCTIVRYARELISPPTDPYSPVVEWLKTNVGKDQTVWVIPDYMTYPLMYHAPEPIYAWQLIGPAAGQFKDLPPIHFAGQVPPDFVVAFGPGIEVAQTAMRSLTAPVRYAPIKEIDVFWKDLYRPELFLRRFSPVGSFDKETEAIHIFSRLPAPISWD